MIRMMSMVVVMRAEDGIRDRSTAGGRGEVDKRQGVEKQ